MRLFQVIFILFYYQALLLGNTAVDTTGSTGVVVILRNGQAANINLLDTTGNKIVYLRRGSKIKLDKSLIKLIVINSDTVDYSKYQSPKQKKLDMPQAATSAPVNPNKPKSITAKEYYSDKAPGMIKRNLKWGNIGNGLTFVGIGAQAIAILTAQDIGLLPSILLIGGGVVANIAGPRIAIGNYYGTTDIIEQAYDCDRKAIEANWRVHRIATGILIAGSIASNLPPKIEFAAWENADGRSSSSLSLSPIGLVICLIADIIYIINNEHAAVYAYSMKRKCVPKQISIVPSYDNRKGAGLQLSANF